MKAVQHSFRNADFGDPSVQMFSVFIQCLRWAPGRVLWEIYLVATGEHLGYRKETKHNRKGTDTHTVVLHMSDIE